MSNLVGIAQSPLEKCHIVEISAFLNVINEKLSFDRHWNESDSCEHFVGIRITTRCGFHLHLSVKFVPICQKHIYFCILCSDSVFHSGLHKLYGLVK